MSQEKVGGPVETYEFLDSWAQIGHFANPHPGAFFSVEEMLEEMRHSGVAEAAVHHAFALHFDPDEGNLRTLDAIKGRREFLPVWVFAPHFGQPPDNVGKQIEQMLRSGSRIARMRFSEEFSARGLDPVLHYNILSALEVHSIPLSLDYDNPGIPPGEWEALDAALERFHSLPVILSAPRFQEENARMFGRLARFPNLFIETSGLESFEGVELITQRFGSRRLIFGARSPYFNAAVAVFRILFAGVRDEDKKAIAGDNLRSLMQSVRI
ncbi:MAG TPA: amidohydrolase family protein [Candidatus Brocadiia bacterium]|nr:amidohydrolase family protein [Candidatus Brocadiia bacterium]